MIPSTDITLIGGGIIGLLTARAFVEAGASVTVIDKNRLGQESSWAGGGILLPIYPWRQNAAITTLVRHSLSLYPSLAAELKAATGIDPEWSPCGLLITQTPDSDAARVWCRNQGIVCQSDLPDTSCLQAQMDKPLWLSEIAHIRNPRLLKALRQDLVQKGVQLLECCTLNTLISENDVVVSISTSAGRQAVNQLIFTTGAWTGALCRQFLPHQASPEIKPVKGQMLLFDAEPNTLAFMVLEKDHYLIPRRDGKILAGSTLEDCDFDKTTSWSAYRRLKSFAENLCPALKDCTDIRHWAGLRPGTSRGIPYITRHPAFNNLSINAGHFRNGLVMAPASAQLMVDLILNRPGVIAAESYQMTARH
ncbi:MAG: glycine oxidase ThiO [Gammaproteobacteria bacterium HGW-Gammaproteobacteria-3]|nr:MAG: glycine oxidase ThiO [Gammaproteobacteria bacterium HGW-Gammaproteobacteria-3]